VTHNLQKKKKKEKKKKRGGGEKTAENVKYGEHKMVVFYG